MGCLAALSRFISRLGERGLPLYRLLRKTERFSWTPEAEEALRNLKALLTNAPILVPPATGETLLIYVAATTQVVSIAIVVERREEGHTLLVQRPVNFVSEMLSDTKIRYLQIQKLLYAVILTRRKLSFAIPAAAPPRVEMVFRSRKSREPCSTIGASELNFSVRNGKRWDLTAITT